MPRANLWTKNVPRAELDQRARDARLRLEQLELLLVPSAAATDSWLRRVLCLFSFDDEGRQRNRTRGSLSNRRSSGPPKIQPDWPEVCASCCG